MKLKSILTSALLAAAGMAMITTANAHLISNYDDLILGFRATTGTGDTTNVEFDLGNVDTLVANPSAFSVTLAPDLSNLFGTPGTNSTWDSNSTLLWSVVGTDGEDLVGNGPDGNAEQNNSIYFTVVHGGTPDAPGAVGGQSTIAGNFFNYFHYLDTGNKTSNTTAPNGYSFTVNGTNIPFGYTTEITDNGLSSSDFDYFNTSVENGVSGSPTTANLYEDVEGNSSAELLGTFSLSSAGVLTFADAIPEPSTYALFGLGSLALLFWFRRRSPFPA